MKNNPVDQATRADWKEENINKSNCVSSKSKRKRQIVQDIHTRWVLCRISVMWNERRAFQWMFQPYSSPVECLPCLYYCCLQNCGTDKKSYWNSIRLHILFGTENKLQIATFPRFLFVLIIYLWPQQLKTSKKKQQQQKTTTMARIWRKIVQRMDFCRLFCAWHFLGMAYCPACVYMRFFFSPKMIDDVYCGVQNGLVAKEWVEAILKMVDGSCGLPCDS